MCQHARRRRCAAAAVDLKRRCGALQNMHLVNLGSASLRIDSAQRMKAAALSGHAGAQVAVCGVERLCFYLM